MTRAQSVPVDVTRDLWDRKAAFWDQRFGEGNDFHTTLVEPTTLRLLDPQAGQVLLDVATGNGAFARKLASLDAQVVAFDFSSVFIGRASERTVENRNRIEYRVIDATNEAQLLSLGKHRYDAAVANMALMDMPAIEPLAHALTQLLKPGGRFVFSVQHPCFNSNETNILAEATDSSGEVVIMNAIKVRAYLHVPPGQGTGIQGEPVPHYYFHRPISEVLGVFFAAGFVMDGIEEPTFAGGGKPLTWEGVGGQIPPVLVVRVRLP